MTSVCDFIITRSLGQARELVSYKRPTLQVLQVCDLKEVSSGRGHLGRLRDFIILGFVPRRPWLFVSVLKPAASCVMTTQTSPIVESSEHSLVIWSLAASKHAERHVQEVWRLYMHESLPYIDLHLVATAFRQVEHGQGQVMLQVMSFVHADHNSDTASSGLFEFRCLSLPGDDLTRQNEDCACQKYMRFSSIEARWAQVCFAHAGDYVSVLLLSRCIFLFDQDYEASKPSKNAYWAIEGSMDADVPQTLPDARVLEIDLYIEALVGQQRKPFGYRPSAWQYLCTYHPNPQDVIRDQSRGHKLDAARGTVIVVAVMAEDSTTVMLVTLFIDPVARRESKEHFTDVLTLAAKTWRLQRPMTESREVLEGLITQQAGIPIKHACAVHCATSHRKNESHVLATFESDATQSLDLIEGEYWNLSGKDWSNARID